MTLPSIDIPLVYFPYLKNDSLIWNTCLLFLFKIFLILLIIWLNLCGINLASFDQKYIKFLILHSNPNIQKKFTRLQQVFQKQLQLKIIFYTKFFINLSLILIQNQLHPSNNQLTHLKIIFIRPSAWQMNFSNFLSWLHQQLPSNFQQKGIQVL
ncbi:unnamed protein product [Paramecium octaurelia]|uniref:Transmembrane protein n=1 Tax=Paramecium octaurelia TaxID=43137 RepID=A0A8S1WIW4_PAROT|nr:unnamed protein product [Paramecium octaurelia]